MQKTNKSLLVKVLTVLCALCFTLVLAFGLVGCAKEQVTIVGSDLVNGKLVLTYSDGSSKEYDVIGKDGVDGEDGEDLTECAHERKEVQTGNFASLGAKYPDACKVSLSFCLDCKHMLIETVAHNLETVDGKDATCYEDGYTAGKKCSECDYLAEGSTVISKETVAHTEKTYFIAYEEDNKSPCTHGGFLVTICEVCRDAGYSEILERIDVAPLGHQSTKWYFAQESDKPTTDKAGVLTAAICDECGMSNVTTTIPALNDVDYEKTTTVEKEQCTDTETYNYKLTKGEQEFNFTVVTLPGNHKITDTVVFEDAKVYDFDEEIFKTFGNADKTCAPAGFEVYFECVECGEAIKTRARLPHQNAVEAAGENDPIVSVPATCTEVGYYTDYTCKCGTQIVYSDNNVYGFNDLLEIPALGPEFVSYTAVVDGDTVKLVSECTRYAKCGITNTLDLTNATYTFEETEDTCTAAGKKVWTITAINGETLETPLVAESLGRVLPHKLGDEEMDLTKVYDWTVYEAKGLKGFGNVTKTCADGGFDVYFHCAGCDTDIKLKAEVPHKVPEDPDTSTTVNEAITVVPAECGKPGSESYECAVCKQTQTKEIPELKHEYKYTMVITGDTAVITGTCVHGDLHKASDPAKTIEVYNGPKDALEKREVVKATCEVDGIVEYSWNNGAAKAEVNEGKALHMIGEKYIDDAVPQVVGNGIKSFGNSTPACDAAVPGQGYFNCTVCEKDILVDVREDHKKPTDSSLIQITPAECGKEGSIKYNCTECGKALSDPILPLDHINTYDMTTYVAPTETTAGSVDVKCTREGCGATATVVLPALNEAVEYTEGTTATYYYVVASAASCQADGVLTYTYIDATYGKVTFNIVTPAIDHDTHDVPSFVWDYAGKRYTGKVCKLGADDQKHIVIISVVDIPQN